MPSEKRSISFDEAVLAEAERRVASSGGNLSAFVDGAVLRELRVARGIELLGEDEAEFRAVSEDIRRKVAGEWPA
ncbi:MAG TPA: hypothetical protein VG165_07750 [Solirubrobacteraceae bacterium]|jgi:hypothetical protein|nr:hypothetical protein [Solirubrobacteraceae bacterium]